MTSIGITNTQFTNIFNTKDMEQFMNFDPLVRGTQTSNPIDIDYNKLQCQKGDTWTDGIQEDGEAFCREFDRHEYLSNLPSTGFYSGESLPHQEPWWNGKPSHTHYANIEVTELYRYADSEFIGRIIGKAGCHLQYITNSSGAHYIWWNTDVLGEFANTEKMGRFEIWGTPYAIQLATKMLLDQIDFVKRGYAYNADNAYNAYNEEWDSRTTEDYDDICETGSIS